jgi:hypothetical protein
LQRQRKRAGYKKSGNSRASLAALEKKGEAARERLAQCVLDANRLLPAFPEAVAMVAAAAAGPEVVRESASHSQGEQAKTDSDSDVNADAGTVNKNAGAEKGISDCVVRGAALVHFLQHARNRRPLARRDGGGDEDQEDNPSHRRPRREGLQQQSKEGQFGLKAGLPVPAPLPLPLLLAQSAVEETWERVVSECVRECEKQL